MSCTWFSRNNGVKRLLVRLTCTLNYVEANFVIFPLLCFEKDGWSEPGNEIHRNNASAKYLSHFLIVSEQSRSRIL